MSSCFIWFPISDLGEPKIYHDSGVFYKNWGFYLEGVWLWRISGGYSQDWKELFLVGYIIDRNCIIITCTTSGRTWSPRSSIWRSEHGSSTIRTIVHWSSQGQEFTVSVSDSNEIRCCARSPRSPRCSICWCENGSWITNCHKFHRFGSGSGGGVSGGGGSTKFLRIFTTGDNGETKKRYENYV